MSEAGSRRTDAETRRQQIVDAASKCARRDGFHGASMAEIAKEAGLSVGQIYRYFENKEAIIAAIVARELAEMGEKFAEMQGGPEPVLDTILGKCATAIGDLYETERAALSLEVVAEAARNPRVAAILQSADIEERAMQHDLLRQVAPPEWDDSERNARGEVISMLFEGMMVRGVKYPDSDHAAVAKVLRSVLRRLMVEPLNDDR